MGDVGDRNSDKWIVTARSHEIFELEYIKKVWDKMVGKGGKERMLRTAFYIYCCPKFIHRQHSLLDGTDLHVQGEQQPWNIDHTAWYIPCLGLLSNDWSSPEVRICVLVWIIIALLYLPVKFIPYAQDAVRSSWCFTVCIRFYIFALFLSERKYFEGVQTSS